jgi:hypothetical protein
MDASVPDLTWPLTQAERARLALAHEPEASASPDGFRLATCVVPECKRPMVSMWHLWLDAGGLKKEIHMCHECATDIYGAPIPGSFGSFSYVGRVPDGV